MIMKRVLKTYFIPHEENNYHPHILHTKRVMLYGGLFVAMKIIVFVFVLLLPLEVFVMPDVLAGEQQQIITLVNSARIQKGLPALVENGPLDYSSDLKAADMAKNEYFSHVGPNNQRLSSLLEIAGYKYLSAGENLAMGFSSAKDVVAAWIKSPTHYANLLDSEFQDTGVALESGYFNGVPTVYVAQHFGWPASTRLGGPVGQTTIVKTTDNNVVKVKDQPVAALNNQNKKEVAAVTIQKEKIALADTSVNYDKVNSKVYWGGVDGTINLSVMAFVSGAVESVKVSIGGITMTLHPENDIYVGGAVVSQKLDEFFKVIISPVIEIKSAAGEVITDTIDWNTVKIVSPTPTEKYINARGSLGFLTNIFSVSKNIYIVFIAFFFIALLLNIFIEIKKQHPRVIAQTIGLISLLLYLAVI